MGETIDLNDLSNIEESFTNVKMYGGVAPGAKNNRDFQPGTQVLHGGDIWEFVKYDEKDSRYLIIKRDDEEIRVYNQAVVIYEPPPKSTPNSGDRDLSFSPKSPIETYQYSPGDVVLYLGNRWEVVKVDDEDSRYIIIKRDGEEKRVYHLDLIMYEPPTPETPVKFSPRSPDEPAPRTPENDNGPRTPDEPAPRTPDEPAPRTPDEPAPRTPDELAPRTPDEPAPRTPDEPAPRTPENDNGPRTPDEPIPRTPDEPVPTGEKVPSDTDLLKLLESLEKKNLPTVKLVKQEELVEDPTREDTGVFNETNKLLSRIHSKAREEYLEKIKELNELMKKNKADFTFTENDKEFIYSYEDTTKKITKPIYRSVHVLLSNLNRDLEMIEYELREKRDQAILNPDPKLNREIQKLNEKYKLYSQSLEVYHQYYSLVNRTPEKKAEINALSAQRNSNRVEQIKLFSEITSGLNSGTYDNDALNTIIEEYLSKGTRDIETKLREKREENTIEHVILNDYSVESKKAEEEKPKRRVVKKRKEPKKTKSKPKKKSKEELLTDVLTTLEAAEGAAEGAEEGAAEGATEGVAEGAAEGDYTVTPDTLIKGKPVALDGKKQFKEEDVIKEKCSENEDCKGFTEKTYSDGKVKYFPRDSTKTVPEKDHRAFVKTGGGMDDLANEVENLLDSEAETFQDPEIKTITIKPPMTGGAPELKSSESSNESGVEVLDLPDDIDALVPEEQDYSFIDSYETDESDEKDYQIPIELNIVKTE